MIVTDSDEKGTNMRADGVTKDESVSDGDAVQAVLALHVSDGDSEPECRGCRAECLYCEGVHAWPCATVRAVRGG